MRRSLPMLEEIETSSFSNLLNREEQWQESVQTPEQWPSTSKENKLILLGKTNESAFSIDNLHT